MSSAATSDGAAGSGGPASAASFGGVGDGGGGRRESTTFWCHECDMSVTLLFSSPSLVCPHCRGDFLEEMEALPPRRRPPSLRPRSRSLSPPNLRHPDGGAAAEEVDAFLPYSDHDDLVDFSILGGQDGGSASSSAAEEYYEVLHRLINRVVPSPPSNINHDGPAFGGGDGGVPRPASKASVEAIPTVRITEGFLAADPSLLCAVCKDEFALQTEARQLPCSHIYHPDCILPWLSHHNSCPVCRFQLPTDDQERRRRPARVDDQRVLFGNLLDDDEVERDVREIQSMLRLAYPGRTGLSMEDTDALADADDDIQAIGGVLRRMARRRRLPISMWSSLYPEQDAAVMSTTQLAQAEMVSEGAANSTETVSSLWPPGEGTSVGGSSAGGGGRIDEEGDIVMSECVNIRGDHM